MCLGGSATAASRSTEPQAAHRVVHDGGHDRTEDQRGEGERQDEPPPRIGEDKEPDVKPEAWVGDVERLRIAPGQVFQGPPTGGTTGEQAYHNTYRYQHPDESGLQQFPVAFEQRTARHL